MTTETTIGYFLVCVLRCHRDAESLISGMDIHTGS